MTYCSGGVTRLHAVFFFTNAAPAASAVQKQNKRSDKRKQKPNPHLDKKKQKNEKRIPASQRLTRVTGQKKKQANFVKVGRLGKEVPSPIEEKNGYKKNISKKKTKKEKKMMLSATKVGTKLGFTLVSFFLFFGGGGHKILLPCHRFFCSSRRIRLLVSQLS